VPVSALDLIGNAKPETPIEVRIVNGNKILLSRGIHPVAVLSLRGTDDVLRVELTREGALAALNDPSSLKVVEGADQIITYRQTNEAGGITVDALLKVSRVAAGFRLLLTGEQAENPSGKPRAELQLFCFGDSLQRAPLLTYADNARVQPRPALPEGENLRARALVYETTPPIDSLKPKQQAQNPEKDLRLNLARSAPADWSARASNGGVLLTTPLLSNPRNPQELGSFVLYAGTDFDSARAELSPIRLNKKETPVRDFLEGSARVYASGANPFSLSDLAVVAEIAFPPKQNGDVEIKRLPCFFWESGSQNRAEGEFRFRFAPPLEGVYGVRISIVTATGQLKTDALSFRAGPPASAGFVKYDAKAKSFRFDDGSPFVLAPSKIAVSENGAVDPIRAQLRAMNKQSRNVARLNIALGPLRTEGPKLGQFDADVALHLDEILLAAQARDIHLLLVVEDALSISLESPTHPYFRESGGPLAATPEFFRNPAVKRAFQSRMAYVAARYGAYRSVLSWELVQQIDRCWAPLKNEPNEVRLTPEESDLARRARRDVQEWLASTALSMRGMDGHGHPVGVTTELDFEKKWPDLKKVEHLDWIGLPAENP